MSDDKLGTIESVTHDEAWVIEFEKQLTPKLIDSLRNYARTRSLAVATAGRKVDGYYARELVQDAIGDTWSGRLKWEPLRCTLVRHLVGAIGSRSYKHRRHAEDNPHDALGDDTPESQNAEEEASSSTHEIDRTADRVFARETLSQIRMEAAGDKPLLRVLDAFAAGAVTKGDVLALARMKGSTYHNAHIRLTRIVRRLTDRKLALTARA